METAMEIRTQTNETSPRRSMDLAMRTMFVLALVAFVGSILYAMQPGPSERALMHFDGPTFDSVESLSWNADFVVQAKVVNVLGPQVDFGGEEPVTVRPDGEKVTRSGLPVMLYEVQVEQSLVGDTGKGETITLALLNHDKIDSEHTVELRRGDQYMFFMAKMEAKDVAGLDTRGQDLYLPLNYNNGVMQTNGKSVQMNSWILGLDDFSAKFRSFELSDLETERGFGAVENERFRQANVEVDMGVLLQTIEAAR